MFWYHSAMQKEYDCMRVEGGMPTPRIEIKLKEDSKMTNRGWRLQINGNVCCIRYGQTEYRKRIVISSSGGRKQFVFLAEETKI